ncbi:hypothetical protein GCM10027056_02470 [Glaciibacter psychrotolerans]
MGLEDAGDADIRCGGGREEFPQSCRASGAGLGRPVAHLDGPRERGFHITMKAERALSNVMKPGVPHAGRVAQRKTDRPTIILNSAHT